jgi:O-antigen/teichoic acid export membrane protein
MRDAEMQATGLGGASADSQDGSPLSEGKQHKKRAIEAASFVVVGFGLSQVIRLGGNIVLTRLLAPEIFGVLTIARVFFSGLGLFSDIGIEPSIIRSARANDPVFQNTAWTMQIIRNLILAALAALIGVPAAILYKQPILAILIPCVGLTSVPDGFRSTSLVMMDKELMQRKLTIIELVVQVASLFCMILAAYLMRSVWALLIGDLVGTLIRTIWSHAINTSHPNRFALEPEASKEILSFGKWILISTALMFLASQSDRIILGKLFPMAWFGVYSVAVSLAELPKQVISRLNAKVIYPLISKYVHLSHDELRRKISKARLPVLLALATLLAFFGCFGDLLIDILYDQRYREAAWMLPLLAFGMWPLLLLSTIDGSLLAIGKPMYAAIGNLAKFIFMLIALPLAHRLGGELAVLIVIAANDVPSYIILNIGLVKEKLSFLKQDACLTLALVAMSALLIGLRILIGIGLPGQSNLVLHFHLR